MSIKLVVAAALILMAAAQNTCCSDSTVTVSGGGKANGLPDIATFSVTVSETGKTSKEASSAANIKSNQVLKILSNNNVPQTDIKTTQLNISPQYDWNNGVQTLKAQQASQTISVKLRNIKTDGTTIGALIDALATINNITISGITFDISDKSNLQKQARQSAYNDAKAKAQQYAQLSGMRLGDAITISDSSSSYNPPIFYAKAAGDASTPVLVGQLEVTNDVTLTFKLL